VVVVTARPPRHVVRVLGAAGWSDALAVCCNGAVVHDVRRERVVTDSRLEPATAVAVAAAFAERMPEVAWAVETGVELVSGPGWGHTFSGEEAHRHLDDLDDLWRHPLVKVLGWSDRRSADELLAVVRGLGLPGLEPTHSGGHGVLELSARGTTKAGTLAALCEEWAVGASEVVAFGDMPNDVPLLRWAGRSWAVANAHAEARAAADHTTASNDDDGVAVVLEELFA
jgi:hydroxymethylpyrimidine pyrophosphatase-like HAD family hydrolase